MNDDSEWKLIFLGAVCVFFIWLFPGCTSGRTGTSEITYGPSDVATSQPVDVSQDVSTIKAEAEVDAQVVADLQTKLSLLERNVTQNTTYGTDVWTGRIAVIMSALSFAFAWWMSNRAYWRQRSKRLRDREAFREEIRNIPVGD